MCVKNTTYNGCDNGVWVVEHVEFRIGKTNTPLMPLISLDATLFSQLVYPSGKLFTLLALHLMFKTQFTHLSITVYIPLISLDSPNLRIPYMNNWEI